MMIGTTIKRVTLGRGSQARFQKPCGLSRPDLPGPPLQPKIWFAKHSCVCVLSLHGYALNELHSNSVGTLNRRPRGG